MNQTRPTRLRRVRVLSTGSCCVQTQPPWSSRYCLAESYADRYSQPDTNLWPDIFCDSAGPKQYAAQQGMRLFLLIAQRVPSSLATVAIKQLQMCVVRGVAARAWPDDLAAPMRNV